MTYFKTMLILLALLIVAKYGYPGESLTLALQEWRNTVENIVDST